MSCGHQMYHVVMILGCRDREMHEASRRMMSVLLGEMEGFNAGSKRAVVIGATNRKADLDTALLSRFDMVGSLAIVLAGAHLG